MGTPATAGSITSTVEKSIMRRPVRPEESVVETIVRSVADETGRDPTDIQPIARTVGPEAIGALYARASEDNKLAVSFRHDGCHVTVEENSVTLEAVQPQRSE